jgi:hypothetical protein
VPGVTSVCSPRVVCAGSPVPPDHAGSTPGAPWPPTALDRDSRERRARAPDGGHPSADAFVAARRLSASTSAGVCPGEQCGRDERSLNPAKPCSRYHRSHRCTACRDTPSRAATSLTDDPDRTSNTARYRCSTTLSSTSTRRSVTHLPRTLCHAATATRQAWPTVPVMSFCTALKAARKRAAAPAASGRLACGPSALRQPARLGADIDKGRQ